MAENEGSCAANEPTRPRGSAKVVRVWKGSPPLVGDGGDNVTSLHRASSMPDDSTVAAGASSSSSLFYRHRDVTKSSRSIRHDLEHLKDGEEDEDESDNVTRSRSALNFDHESLSINESATPRIRRQESSPHEAQPLLGGSAASHPRSSWESIEEDQRLVRIAAAFLSDYEAGQAPTLPPHLMNITDLHIHLHAIRFSKVWRGLVVFATGCLFVGSCFEGSDEDEDWETYDGKYLAERIQRKQKILSFCTVIPVVVFALDIFMMGVLFSRRGHTERLDTLLGADLQRDNNGHAPSSSTKDTGRPKKARTSRSFWWAMPVVLFLAVLSFETLVVILSGAVMRRRIWSSLAKPIVLFYVSSRTRNALDALNRVIRVVLRVILIELFLIFTFGSVAVQLFGDEFASFEGLPISFLSMFQLSTTVVNPSLWMPVVSEYGRSSSIFFIIFLVTR